jgi:hypothetical protein
MFFYALLKQLKEMYNSSLIQTVKLEAMLLQLSFRIALKKTLALNWKMSMIALQQLKKIKEVSALFFKLDKSFQILFFYFIFF